VANGIVLVGVTLLPTTAQGLGTGQLVALATDDGHPLWHAPLAAPPTPPAIADGIVVIGSGAVGFEASAASASEAGPSQFIGSLAAYTMSTSQRLWRRALAGPPSPIVANGIVYASVVTASGGDLVAYTPNDGKLLWREPLTGTPVGGMPVVANGVIALGDAVLTAGTQTVNLEGHAASDGKLVWSVPLLGSVNGLAAAPDAVYASIAVTPGSGDTPKDLLESHAASDGKLLWSVQPGGFIPFAPVVGP
jgi:outer membrane protein assembly factor BamB